MDQEARIVHVGLSFGGVPSTLVVPLAAVTGFADPQVRFGLRFPPPEPVEAPEPPEAAPTLPTGAAERRRAGDAEPTPQVVSLDAFRRRTPPNKS